MFVPQNGIYSPRISNWRRPIRKIFCSTQAPPPIPLPKCGPSYSRANASHSGCGRLPSKHSWSGITKWPQMKRRRLKIANEKKQPSGPMTAWNGIRSSSVGFREVLVAPTKARRISIGSSTHKCKSPQAHGLIQTYERCSDAHNPELATKQILSIAPILEGQTESSQYQIPPHRERHEAAPPDHNGATPNAAQPTSVDEKLEEVQRKDTRTSDVDTFVDAKP